MPTQKLMVLAAGMLAAGALRLPIEARLATTFKEQRLLPVKLEVETLDRIEQTSWAVAIGGLRTVVASFWNLKAVGLFMDQKWYDLARAYDMMVDLAPRTRNYWETGAWHQAYNAASYYISDSELPPLRRREAWRGSIANGRAFLERGIRNNPDDWRLRAYLGMLLIDPNKFTAFHDRNEALTAAAQAYRAAARNPQAPTAKMERFELYALARIKGREDEALRLARELHADPRSRFSTLLMLLFVLECHVDPQMDPVQKALEIYGTPERAYKNLSQHWFNSREGYPTDGMARAIRELELRLAVPDGESVLKRPLPPPADPNDWFQP